MFAAPLKGFAGKYKNGVNFAAIAPIFTKRDGRSGRGSGWIHEAELNDNLKDIVPGLKHGTISQPIKTVTGYRLPDPYEVAENRETA